MRGEPLSVPEIPHPRELKDQPPFVESGEWFACGQPGKVRQGWKVYVPLTILNARELIMRLAPVVIGAGLHFKYIKNLKTLRKLNAGMFGYPQIGKCFVIYLPKPGRRIIDQLKRAVAAYRDQCPAVPCAIPFGDGLPLYYRFGSYDGDQIELGGTRVADVRENAAAAVPEGVIDVLSQYSGEIREDPAIRSFLLRFPVFEALSQQGKCAICLALNLSSETFQEVILKVGYHRGQIQPDGNDGCTFLRRELMFYRELERRGIKGLTPQLIDALDVPRKVILALEYIPGTSLLRRMLSRELTLDHLDRCWELIGEFHANGVFFGDAKLANFLATDDGDLRAIDFEAAGVIGKEGPSIRTFILANPNPADPVSADRLHFLASVLYPYEEGRYSWHDRHVDLTSWLKLEPETEASIWALNKLRAELPGTC